MKLKSLTSFLVSFVLFGLVLAGPIVAYAADVNIFRVLKVNLPAGSSVDEYLKAERLGDDTREIVTQLIAKNNCISADELFSKGGVAFLTDFYPDMKIFGEKGVYAYHVAYELPATFFGPEPEKLFCLRVLRVDVPAGTSFDDYLSQERLDNSAHGMVHEIISSLNGNEDPGVIFDKGGKVYLVDFFPDHKVMGEKGIYAYHVSRDLPPSFFASK